jgi:outer membrane murein-binding lipoprotein Lpp
MIVSISVSAENLISTAPDDYKIVVYVKGGLIVDDFLQAAIDDITYVDWVVLFESISESDLSDADMLLMIQSSMEINFTSEEKDLVSSWFENPGKTLWVPGDSDFSDQYKRIDTANEVLEAVDSQLRLENCECTDASTGADANYRVYGVTDQCSEDVKFLVNGVKNALFHGPGVVIGYVGGEYYDLISTSIDNIHVIMTTSENGTAEDIEPPAPEVHLGFVGYCPLMVLEKYSNGNNLIVTADSPFYHYTPMYKPELDNNDRYGVRYPQQGATLFQNIVDYGIRIKTEVVVNELNEEVTSLTSEVSSLTSEVSSLTADKTALTADKAALQSDLDAANGQVGTWQMYAGVALLLGLVIGVFVGPMLKK